MKFLVRLSAQILVKIPMRTASIFQFLVQTHTPKIFHNSRTKDGTDMEYGLGFNIKKAKWRHQKGLTANTFFVVLDIWQGSE